MDLLVVDDVLVVKSNILRIELVLDAVVERIRRLRILGDGVLDGHVEGSGMNESESEESKERIERSTEKK